MWKLVDLRPLPMPIQAEVLYFSMKNEKDDDKSRLMILKFSNQEEMKKFFQIWKDTELGELVKSSKSGDLDYSNGRGKDKKSTRWSKWGMENLDDKKSEKPSLI